VILWRIFFIWEEKKEHGGLAGGYFPLLAADVGSVFRYGRKSIATVRISGSSQDASKRYKVIYIVE